MNEHIENYANEDKEHTFKWRAILVPLPMGSLEGERTTS
jgi:hypothetical protein